MFFASVLWNYSTHNLQLKLSFVACHFRQLLVERNPKIMFWNHHRHGNAMSAIPPIIARHFSILTCFQLKTMRSGHYGVCVLCARQSCHTLPRMFVFCAIFPKIPATSVDEATAFVRSLESCPKTGLHNPMKNPERWGITPACTQEIRFLYHLAMRAWGKVYRIFEGHRQWEPDVGCSRGPGYRSVSL